MKYFYLLFALFLTSNAAATGQHTGIGGSSANPPAPPRPAVKPQSALVDVLEWLNLDTESDTEETTSDQASSETLERAESQD